MGFGPEGVVSGSGSSGQSTPFYEVPGVSLRPSPNHIQVSGSAELQIDDPLKGVAVQFCPEIRHALKALGLHFGTVTTQGNALPAIYTNATALEPDGTRNDVIVSGDTPMTSNTTPSPNVVAATDEGVKAAWYAADGVISSNAWQTTGTPSEGSPISWMRDYGAENAVTKNKLGITTYSPTNYCPEDFKIQGSNESEPDVSNDSHWTDLGTFTGEVMLGGAFQWFGFTNGTAYRAYRVRITKTNDSGVLRVTEFALIDAQEEEAPGALLTSGDDALDAIDSGAAGAARWAGGSDFTSEYQMRNTKDEWLVIMGDDDSGDFTLTYRRRNTTRGSSFHRALRQAKYTIDGGTTWTKLSQDGMDAMINFIANPDIDWTPKLVLGQKSGEGIYIPGSGTLVVPEEGIFYGCGALDIIDTPNDDWYWIYTYGSDGDITNIIPSYTDPVLYQGFLVMNGQTEPYYRLIGAIAPQEVQSGYAGPVLTSGCHTLENLYGDDNAPIGKSSMFSGTTTASAPVGASKWYGDNTYKMLILAINRQIYVSATGIHHTSSGVATRFAIDSDSVPDVNSTSANSGRDAELRRNISNGLHEIVPLLINGTAAAVSVTYKNSGTTEADAGIQGLLSNV